MKSVPPKFCLSVSSWSCSTGWVYSIIKGKEEPDLAFLPVRRLRPRRSDDDDDAVKKEKSKQTEKPLLPVSLEATHVGSAGLAGRTRPLARHAPAGACHQQGASRRRSGICRLDPTLANGPDMSIRLLAGRPCELTLAARVPSAPVSWSVLDATCWESPR